MLRLEEYYIKPENIMWARFDIPPSADKRIIEAGIGQAILGLAQGNGDSREFRDGGHTLSVSTTYDVFEAFVEKL